MVTELDILIAARDQIKKGYTSVAYVGVKRGSDETASAETASDLKALLKANDDAKVVTCAIGGVEHALYTLCGRFVNENARDTWAQAHYVWDSDADVERYDLPTEKQLARIKSDTTRLYAQTMMRLNKIARKRGFRDIEEPNVDLPEWESKPIVLDIYRRAIKQVRDEQRRKS
jgi:hypothetical protein